MLAFDSPAAQLPLHLLPPTQAQLRAAMDADPRWQQYVKERLEPRNAEENVFAWKCGRPTVHEPGPPGA